MMNGITHIKLFPEKKMEEGTLPGYDSGKANGFLVRI
jgi:hypothetical protein